LSIYFSLGRHVHERPQDRAHWDTLREIIALKPVAIPIIANGDVLVHEDIVKMKEYTGTPDRFVCEVFFFLFLFRAPILFHFSVPKLHSDRQAPCL
jgi:tRNA-dihydrouridine synthase